MNKNFYFLLSVVALILVAVVMIFYPSELEISSNVDNITFKNTKLGESNLVFEDMNATIDMTNHRRLKVAKYRDNAKLQASSKSSVNYVNSELTLASGSNLPRTTLAANTPQGFRRYISDNSSAHSVVNIPGFQQMRIASEPTLSQGGGVVQIGNISAVNFDDCSHENIDWSNDGPWGHCTDCGGNGTITDGSINGDGSIDIGKMDWVPLGDVVVPMLMLALTYLLMILVRNRHS